MASHEEPAAKRARAYASPDAVDRLRRDRDSARRALQRLQDGQASLDLRDLRLREREVDADGREARIADREARVRKQLDLLEGCGKSTSPSFFCQIVEPYEDLWVSEIQARERRVEEEARALARYRANLEAWQDELLAGARSAAAR
jgi:hypothetical protein